VKGYDAPCGLPIAETGGNRIMDRGCIWEIVSMSASKQAKRRTIKLYTIGSKMKTAEEFFTLLKDAKVRRVIDVRLENTSHLLSFTKVTHLRYLLREVGGIDYRHDPKLAPSKNILSTWKASKKTDIDWKRYKDHFIPVLEQRKIETLVTPDDLDHACLLCSEPAPENCHRRLVAEYLRDKWSDRVVVGITHL